MENDKAVFAAGAGKSIIKYPENFFPYSGFRGRYLTGVRDEIYARVLRLDDGGNELLFISLELGDITDEWAPEISQKTGIPVENIFLTATHAHNVPYANSTWGERVGDQEKTEPFCRCCLEAIFNAIEIATSKMRPVRVAFNEGSCDVNVSRVHRYEGNQEKVTAAFVSAANPHAYSDKTVAVITFTDEEGHIVAYLFNYAVHSSVQFRQIWDKSKGGVLITGDLAGAAMRYVEERSGDAVALYTLGAAGDQIPKYTMIHRVFDGQGNCKQVDYGDEAGVVLTDAMAGELGEEVLLAAKKAESLSASPCIKVANTTVSAMGKEEWKGGPPMEVPRDYQYTKTEMVDIKLSLIRIGSIEILTVPAEIVASLGKEFKNIIRREGASSAMIISQCNGALQYISDDEGYENKTVEANSSHFMQGVGGIMSEGIIKLTHEVKRSVLYM